MRGGSGPLTLSTAPFPGFATDMQAQFMAMLTLANGASVLTETIFENRYMHVPELARMGATSMCAAAPPSCAASIGLVGAPVMATDLRASMSLILAGLAAEGETQVNRVYHLDRGYERLEEKLQAVGADIERVGGLGIELVQLCRTQMPDIAAVSVGETETCRRLDPVEQGHVIGAIALAGGRFSNDFVVHPHDARDHPLGDAACAIDRYHRRQPGSPQPLDRVAAKAAMLPDSAAHARLGRVRGSPPRRRR
jgi:hypothetical protein